MDDIESCMSTVRFSNKGRIDSSSILQNYCSAWYRTNRGNFATMV